MLDPCPLSDYSLLALGSLVKSAAVHPLYKKKTRRLWGLLREETAGGMETAEPVQDVHGLGRVSAEGFLQKRRMLLVKGEEVVLREGDGPRAGSHHRSPEMTCLLKCCTQDL